MSLFEIIQNYSPKNEQEARDKAQMLQFMSCNDNYLTREKIEGGRWVTQTFDFFHLPLMVKENTILAVGDRIDVPDYDFSENVTFVLSEFADGSEDTIFVTDKIGNHIREVHAVRNGNQIRLTVKGGSKNWNCRMMIDHEETIEKTEDGALITLKK